MTSRLTRRRFSTQLGRSFRIYAWILGKKSQASRKTFDILSNAGVLYCRSKESLKNFWKNWRKFSVEECIEQLISKDAKYSHNYAKPVYPFEALPLFNPKKRQRAKEAEKENEEEKVEEPHDENPHLRKRARKRKIKKAESERVKETNLNQELKESEALLSESKEADPVIA